ncbi:hypothetical protein JTE90_007162 [Oedothorax gibbosus]|uniref:Insulin-degrading enzyme n=1 Tax=Oedothorax gibbosus TaxID=931172 RepID=A0AAV6UWQ6_9ARAC|nr:hypothetical protein JTE90_007162 [Oedothorax gibbosus]
MSDPSQFISKVYDNIKKSNGDSRAYRGLELKNGMKVLLVSDSSTDKSAAAIDVQVGSLSEPRDFPGLAHFCEHMLFLGTEKYPSENEYNKYLQEHGGSSNAYTAEDNTCYYFDVSPSSLVGALDRFSQFFLSPLFTESATEREVNAVHSEHQQNVQNDGWRLIQLKKATCNPNHDFSKFGTGNIDTLFNDPKSKGVDIRDELLKFHENFYSSNIMGLVIYGKETLEELTDIVVPLFSSVINKNVKMPEWKDHPFDSNHLRLKGYVFPVKNIRTLVITFPIPDLNHEYRSNPGSYLGHLIGHEGPGSLLSELKSRGWANTIVAGPEQGCRGFAFFIVDFQLTLEGIEHVDDIITLLFQYLAMLKEEGPKEWISKECQKLTEMTFRFKDRERPQSYVASLANRLFLYPMEEVLSGPYLIQDYKPELIKQLLNLLTPENIRIAVVGKKFEDICCETEKWYGTKYKLEPIEGELLENWKTVKTHPHLKLPAPNDLIPTNFEQVTLDTEVTKYPVLIKNTPMCRLWFKQDDEFLLPKANLTFSIKSPMAYVDPFHFNLCHIYLQLVTDSLNEYSYAAELAGLSHALGIGKFEITLAVQGYNDKLHILLEKILEGMTNLKIDKTRFEISKERLQRSIGNFRAEQPYQQATYYNALLLAERHWTNEDLLNCLDEITIEAVQEFIPRFFSRVCIEALMYGNLQKQQALGLMTIVESILRKNMDSKYLMPSQLIREREVQLSDRCHYVYEAVNEVHSSSSVDTYYQCGVHETRSKMLLKLLADLISEPCFNYLRTQEQLGYIVSSSSKHSNGVHGIRFIVQSDKPPSYIDGRIEAFIQYFDKYLQELSDAEYQNHVRSVTEKLLEKPKKLSVQNMKYWREILSQQFNFDRDNIEVACLATLTKDELYSYFKELIADDAPKRKKLSVHVLSSACKSLNESTECILEEANGDGLIPPPPEFRPPVKVDDVRKFKNSLGLYPLPAPYIQIPSPFLGGIEKSKL